MSVNSLQGKTKSFSPNSNHCHTVEISYPSENTLKYSSCLGKPAHKPKVTGIHAATQNCLQNETEVDIGRREKQANPESQPGKQQRSDFQLQRPELAAVRAQERGRGTQRASSAHQAALPHSGKPGKHSSAAASCAPVEGQQEFHFHRDNTQQTGKLF